MTVNYNQTMSADEIIASAGADTAAVSSAETQTNVPAPDNFESPATYSADDFMKELEGGQAPAETGDNLTPQDSDTETKDPEHISLEIDGKKVKLKKPSSEEEFTKFYETAAKSQLKLKEMSSQLAEYKKLQKELSAAEPAKALQSNFNEAQSLISEGYVDLAIQKVFGDDFATTLNEYIDKQIEIRNLPPEELEAYQKEQANKLREYRLAQKEKEIEEKANKLSSGDDQERARHYGSIARDAFNKYGYSSRSGIDTEQASELDRMLRTSASAAIRLEQSKREARRLPDIDRRDIYKIVAQQAKKMDQLFLKEAETISQKAITSQTEAAAKASPTAPTSRSSGTDMISDWVKNSGRPMDLLKRFRASGAKLK